MKILNIMTTRIGNTGISAFVLNMAKNIDVSEKQVDYVFTNNPPEKVKGILAIKDSCFFVLPNRNRNPIKYGWKLYQLLKSQKYDIVHIHGNSHTLATELWVSKLAQVPIRIAQAHSNSTNFALLHIALRIPFNSAVTYGVASSQAAGEWLFGNEKFEVIPVGIQAEDYVFKDSLRQKVRMDLGVRVDDHLIGHVGMFTENKNQKYLINLLTNLDKSYKLLLIGDGELINNCKSLVYELGLGERVIFFGESNQVQQLYSAMDLFIFPSYSEGLGLSLIEAQANGLKCYASSTVPIESDITKTVNYFDIKNTTENLAEKIIASPVNPHEPRKNKESYQQAVDSKYNMKNSIHEIESLYDKLLEEKRNG